MRRDWLLSGALGGDEPGRGKKCVACDLTAPDAAQSKVSDPFSQVGAMSSGYMAVNRAS
ncbi:hypothetical protein C8N32_11433 [Rhodovulum imhoffii]|uniref:Uncharacterized protein n=1 Tax=Rhodovulum imhoffii TaxID=365340 RepID=A0A2T5BQB2_9RHOB|nr:hypothetical protein [Rhodovulum imhoffii]PTN01334.1 hypothetical protein C8N32_11433 [Rhodovulum imhoffii]